MQIIHILYNPLNKFDNDTLIEQSLSAVTNTIYIEQPGLKQNFEHIRLDFERIIGHFQSTIVSTNYVIRSKKICPVDIGFQITSLII